MLRKDNECHLCRTERLKREERREAIAVILVLLSLVGALIMVGVGIGASVVQ